MAALSLGRRRRHLLDTRGRIAVYSPAVVAPRSTVAGEPAERCAAGGLDVQLLERDVGKDVVQR
ncbi:hypothetical protein [Streptomyces sp. LN549]|uniref:hypothetical protein n=1 Tax=Streptomyces sp. LN549 TaxID=3112979 RepID=UPI00371FC445